MAIVKEKDIKAICLDVDGTLYSRYQMNLRLALTLFPDVVLGSSFNKVRKQYRETQDNEPPLTEDRKGLLEKQAKIYLKNNNPSDIELEKIIKKIDNQFYKAWEKSFRSIKGFKNMRNTLVKAKEANIVVALLSDFPIADKIKTLNLIDIVDFSASSEQTGYLKPNKKCFTFLTNEINIAPRNCIYVGDSYNKDIVGAKSIDMQTLYIANKNKTDKYSDADYICKDWFEIEALLFN